MTATDPGSAVQRARRIRSFVRREGRLTSGQGRALERLWPRFGIEADAGPVVPGALFGRRSPVILEIGFGNGESLAMQAAASPERDFIGIEVHRPGVGHLLGEIERRSLDNLRVFCADAVEVLERNLPPSCLDGVQIFFPDPWQKKRHHKRRLIQPPFMRLLASRMRPGACLHLATDWEDYAQHMAAVLQGAAEWFEPDAACAPGNAARPETRFERRGKRLGHAVRDLRYRRRDAPCDAASASPASG